MAMGKDKDTEDNDIEATTMITATQQTSTTATTSPAWDSETLNNMMGDECSLERGIELNALPDEILEFILTYLPPYKDLENCSLVCKRWNGIVKNLIRRSKLNLHKGLLDFRLRWEAFTQQTATDIEAKRTGALIKSGPIGINSNLSMIAGRFSHSAVRHENSMYVFGGGSSSDTTFNDLWRFDLSEMRWERPLSMGSYPSPKGSASMVCWQEQLVLFGGWRYPSLHPPYQPWCLFDELHFYDLHSQRWSVQVSVPSPPPMAGHSASVHGDRMIIFGGYQIADGVNSNSNETWCLDLVEHRWWQPVLAGNTKPPPRYGQYQLELDEDHLLVVGGCGGPNSVYSDAWLLDMSRDVWSWRTVPVLNKKFGASHMWCNPACKIDSKLVVLGPTPNMPQDFQLMKQTRVPVGGGAPAPRPGVMQNNHNNPYERQRPPGVLVGAGGGVNGGGGGGPGGAGVFNRNAPVRINAANALRQGQIRPGGAAADGPGGVYHPQGPDDQYFAQRRAILNQHLQSANNNFLNNSNSGSSSSSSNNNSHNNNNLQPRRGSLRDLHGPPRSPGEERNRNLSPTQSPSTSAAISPSTSRMNGSLSPLRNGNETPAGSASPNRSNAPDIEAANRLQRNLALRCRENEPLLPKRFDELYEDPFRLAAFNVPNRPRSISRDHNERIRRMEEKMNAIRNSRRNAMMEQKYVKEPSPKRVKRNVLSLFVCDLASVLDADDPRLQWVEYKNYGIIPGAPERLILSTMVPGNGELILFGGVHKETLSEITHQVSNSVHFLSAPRDIV